MSFLLSLSAIPLIGSITALSPSEYSDAMFASEIEAVTAASNSYNPPSMREDREYMGVIFQFGGRFGYTVTAGDPGSNRISIQVPAEEWDRVVAFWHTHGDDLPIHRYFSNLDTRAVKQTGKPFYMADYTGYLKVFRPGDRTLSAAASARLGLPSRRGFAVGEFVRGELNRPIRIDTLGSQSSC